MQKNLTKNGKPQRYSWGTQKKKKKKTSSNNNVYIYIYIERERERERERPYIYIYIYIYQFGSVQLPYVFAVNAGSRCRNLRRVGPNYKVDTATCL